MKIGIIGAGMIGGTSAGLFAGAGHEVVLSNSRGPETLRSLVAEIGSGVRAMTPDDAATWADVVLLAVPFRRQEALPKPETVKGKIVIDAMNAYDGEGGTLDFGGKTSSEVTAERLPGARIVKAFNTIYFQHLATQGDHQLSLEERRVIFVASDDKEAKATVSSLIEEIGFGPVDAGSLREGGLRLQPGSPVYNQSMTVKEGRKALDAIA